MFVNALTGNLAPQVTSGISLNPDGAVRAVFRSVFYQSTWTGDYDGQYRFAATGEAQSVIAGRPGANGAIYAFLGNSNVSSQIFHGGFISGTTVGMLVGNGNNPLNTLDVRGGMLVSGGATVANITVTGSTAPSNGMYLPSATTLAFATNGNERMRITSGGNVGIGTTNPQGNLHVMGNVILQNSGTALGGIRFPDGSFLASASNLVTNSALVSSNVFITNVTTNATFFPTFVDATSGNLGIRTDVSYTFNASNEHLTAGAFIPINATAPANGMFLPASNVVAISTSSTEKLRVLSDGTVQVGFTGASLGYRLHVNGSALVSSGLQVKPSSTTNNILTFESFDSSNTAMRLMWFYQLGGSSQYMRLTTGTLEFRNDANNIEVSIAQNGALSAVGEITAFSSDKRLKTNVRPIPDALEKLSRLNGVLFRWDDNVESLGFKPSRMDDVGVIAQEVQSVLPEAVRPAPFDLEGGTSKTGQDYLTVQYEKLTALLIEAVKELTERIRKLEEGSGG